jgi:hypothetical protein
VVIVMDKDADGNGLPDHFKDRLAEFRVRQG